MSISRTRMKISSMIFMMPRPLRKKSSTFESTRWSTCFLCVLRHYQSYRLNDRHWGKLQGRSEKELEQTYDKDRAWVWVKVGNEWVGTMNRGGERSEFDRPDYIYIYKFVDISIYILHIVQNDVSMTRNRSANLKVAQIWYHLVMFSVHSQRWLVRITSTTGSKMPRQQ